VAERLAACGLSHRRVAAFVLRGFGIKWSVGVVIPAQNEETTIEACIASVVQALAQERTDHWVVVVADLCNDRTVERARRALGRHGEVIEVRGQVRRDGPPGGRCQRPRALETSRSLANMAG
jgi:hypothetical protein